MKPIVVVVESGTSLCIPVNVNCQSFNVNMTVQPFGGCSAALYQTTSNVLQVNTPTTDPAIDWFPAQFETQNPAAPQVDVLAITTQVQLGFTYSVDAYKVTASGGGSVEITLVQQGLK